MVYLYVGLAGSLGALTRYFVGYILFSSSVFPIATLLINLIGCYVLTYLATRVFRKSKLSSKIQSAITTGFIGSFTTYSTFSVETVDLFEQKEFLLAVVYVFTSVVGGLVMSLLGWKKEVEA